MIPFWHILIYTFWANGVRYAVTGPCQCPHPMADEHNRLWQIDSIEDKTFWLLAAIIEDVAAYHLHNDACHAHAVP